MRFMHGSWISLGLVAALVAGCSDQGKTQRTAEQPQKREVQAQPQKGDVKVATAESPVPADEDEPAEQREPKLRRRFQPKEPGQLPPTKAPIPLEEVGEAELTMPQVALTQGHADVCKVKVGDSLPQVKLPDLQGKEQLLGDLLGEKLTVVAFWNGKKPSALEELSDLESMIAGNFGSKGVTVIGINAGDDPQLAGELAGQAGAKFTNLSDPASATLEQFAAGRVPQLYLVDASGKVIWFDVEYSRITRRDLVQAIRFSLAQN